MEDSLVRVESQAGGFGRESLVRMDDVDTKNRLVRYLISPYTPDRHRSTFRPSGWRLDDFKRNPICLWNHNRRGGPENAIGNLENIEVSDQGLAGSIRYTDKTELARTVFDLVADGVIRAVSHHFGVYDVIWYDEPTRFSELTPEERAYMEEGRIRVAIIDQELREASNVMVGSNPDALDDLSRGIREGKVEDDFLKRSLTVYEYQQVLQRTQSDLKPDAGDGQTGQSEETEPEGLRSISNRLKALEDTVNEIAEWFRPRAAVPEKIDFANLTVEEAEKLLN